MRRAADPSGEAVLARAAAASDRRKNRYKEILLLDRPKILTTHSRRLPVTAAAAVVVVVYDSAAAAANRDPIIYVRCAEHLASVVHVAVHISWGPDGGKFPGVFPELVINKIFFLILLLFFNDLIDV